MGWVLVQEEGGYTLGKLTGHIVDPWAFIEDQDKAMAMLEDMEWADLLRAGSVQATPAKPKRKR